MARFLRILAASLVLTEWCDALAQDERSSPVSPRRESSLCGRLLDKGYRPLVGARVRVGVHVTIKDDASGASSSSWGFALQTDTAARFAFDWDQAWNGGVHREFVLTLVPENELQECEYAPEVLVELPHDPSTDVLELGDLVLRAPNSPVRWTSFDDDSLEVEWARWRGLSRWNGSHRFECEGLLGEMARRGGARWNAYLERLHAELAAASKEGSWEAETLLLPTFRALRRVQGRPDPLRLELAGEGRIECTFPALPVLNFELRNVDATESLELVRGGSYRSGRFARLRFDLRRADGSSVPPLPNEVGMGGGMSTTETLAPEETLSGEADMARYVEPLPPGEYRFRLQYHDQEDIDELLDVRHWMVVESEEVVLIVSPRRVRLTRAEHAAFAHDLRAIDPAKSVLLTSSAWWPDMKFTGAADTPEERLFRAGWQALPALLEALADSTLADAHADWAMGLCFDITGLNPPAWINHVFGSFHWEPKWPSSDGPGAQNFGEWAESEANATIAAERQTYRQRWLDARHGLLVEFQD